MSPSTVPEEIRLEGSEQGVRFAPGLLAGLAASALLWLMIAMAIYWLR